MSYAGNWHGSGQIPARAVEQGLISRFGSIDPDEGGNTARHQLACSTACARPRTASCARSRTPGPTGSTCSRTSRCSCAIRSTATRSSRSIAARSTAARSATASSTRSGACASTPPSAPTGATTTSTGSSGTPPRRQQLTAVRDNDVHQTLVGAYVNEEIAPLAWLRAQRSAAAPTCLSFAVDNRAGRRRSDRPGQRRRRRAPVQPQGQPDRHAAAARRARSSTSIVNYGHGFHSNDVRGVFAHARGHAAHARHRRRDRRARAAVRTLGSRGRALAARSRQRDGLDRRRRHDRGRRRRRRARAIELETRYEITPWLAADLELTFTQVAVQQRRRQRRRPGAGAEADVVGRALRPPRARPGRRRAAAFASTESAIAPRPTTACSWRRASRSSTCTLGYRHRRFDIAFDVENLLQRARFRGAQFATIEPAARRARRRRAGPRRVRLRHNARLAPAPDGSPRAACSTAARTSTYTPATP